MNNHTVNIIEVSNLSFAYTNQLILKNINVVVHKGDYLGIIGPNGGGKTTFIRAILGLITPQHGSIRLFGQDIHQFKGWAKIGYVPQKLMNFDTRFPVTAQEVVAMGRFASKGLLRRLDAKDKQKVTDALEQTGMTANRNRLIGDLSSGQQQRIFIARALAAEPEIIVLDEPTVGVDVEAQEQFYTLLRKLNQQLELTLIVVSHDIDAIAQEVTEIACINQSLVYHGFPDEFTAGNYLAKLYGHDVKFIVHGH
ncbi:zinc ABC transporter ATP-binding protein [Candidatus Gottesmanbacteria bacterium RBG_13_45_10]|uniref:Zinc ABC transporter ATP-binding protein n=1 Tax=Candidatus Gottesmanbacteria bacterium RBG_13_45_10 TaxID=1798370 RepID=A0A1F5ZHH3_9BACT|nr:MAG: zinc ABC transporter ATP-binding protein [Candidatus Gottesmanbacteria bacterium RBG_13_45_10]